MAYDFSELNDKEFEELVVDLLSAHFGKRIERFKAGRDGGVDGRFYSESNKEVILQCKHYLKTGYRGLLSKIKTEESKKVHKLSPSIYLFITSLPLTRKNKNEISKAFEPHIKRQDDIFGQEDLNDLLSQNSKIEEKFFKLWISSTNVFDRIINNAIKGRSEFVLEAAKEKSKLFVITQNYNQAIEKLEDDNVLIITGGPGIGKTTLAENLCLQYVKKGYDFLNIEESISEAENVFKSDEKQIFYFDDFLGSNYLEAIDYKKDSHIVKFIERITRDKSKRFILTSRTNIFNSGIQHSTSFANTKIDRNEYLLKIETLSEYDKAQILYNHIWHSNLSEDFISQLYVSKRYLKIIKDSSFSPRLIEFITDNDRISISDSDKYWEYIQETLNNPSDIWDQCFKRQINEHTRNLVTAVVFNNGSIVEHDLRDVFRRLNSLEGLDNPSHSDKDFDSISETAVRIFLNRINSNGTVLYTLFNPSIADYVINNYSKNVDKIKNVFSALNSIESLSNLSSLFQRGIIDSMYADEIYQYIHKYSFENWHHLDYKIRLSHTLSRYPWAKSQTVKLLKYIIQKPYSFDQFDNLFDLLDQNFDDLDEITESNIFDITIGFQSLNEGEVISFARFVHNKFPESTSLENELEKTLNEYLFSCVDDLISELDLGDFIEYDGYEDFHEMEPAINFKISDARIATENKLIEEIDRLTLPQFEDLSIDFKNIIDSIDFEQLLSDHESDRGHEDEGFGEWHPGPSSPGSNSIDDLFERT